MATLKELREQADELGVETKGLKKAELEDAIAEARAGATRRAGVATVADTLDAKDIVRRKDEEGEGLANIAKDLGVSLAVVMTAYIQETEGAIEPTPKAVAAARAEGNGWRAIAARAGVTKQKARQLFEESGEEDPVGRGRRTGKAAVKGEDDGEAKPKRAAKKATAKKAPAKKATGRKGKKAAAMPDWDTAEEDDIRSAIEGKTVTTAKGDELEVQEVLRFGKNKAKKRVVQVQTEDGKSNIVLETITAVA